MTKKSLSELLEHKSIFGDYTVIGEGKYSDKGRYALCRCKCGIEKDVGVDKLRSGRSTCCRECAKTSAKRVTGLKHGMSKSDVYNIYKGMVNRCNNKRDMHYAAYGAKGISVCDRWLESFENFHADMGERPSKNHSLDRIDNSKGYSPRNCRWATRYEQSANRDITLRVHYKGHDVAVSLLAHQHGISPSTLAMRLKSGWGIEDALAKPVIDKKPVYDVLGRIMTASQIEKEYGVTRWTFNKRIRQGMSVLRAIGLE